MSCPRQYSYLLSLVIGKFNLNITFFRGTQIYHVDCMFVRRRLGMSFGIFLRLSLIITVNTSAFEPFFNCNT